MAEQSLRSADAAPATYQDLHFPLPKAAVILRSRSEIPPEKFFASCSRLSYFVRDLIPRIEADLRKLGKFSEYSGANHVLQAVAHWPNAYSFATRLSEDGNTDLRAALLPAWFDNVCELYTLLQHIVPQISPSGAETPRNGMTPFELYAQRQITSVCNALSTALHKICGSQTPASPMSELPEILRDLHSLSSSGGFQELCSWAALYCDPDNRTYVSWGYFFEGSEGATEECIAKLRSIPPITPESITSLRKALSLAAAVIRSITDVVSSLRPKDPTTSATFVKASSSSEWYGSLVCGTQIQVPSLFSSALIVGDQATQFIKAVRTALNCARRGLESPNTELHVPRGGRLTVIDAIKNVGDCDDGAFAHSFGSIAKVLSDPHRLPGRVLVFAQGVPFSGTSSLARGALIRAIFEYVEAHKGRLWVVADEDVRNYCAPHIPLWLCDEGRCRAAEGNGGSGSSELLDREFTRHASEVGAAAYQGSATLDLGVGQDDDVDVMSLLYGRLFYPDVLAHLKQRCPAGFEPDLWLQQIREDAVGAFTGSKRYDGRPRPPIKEGFSIPMPSDTGAVACDFTPYINGSPGQQITLSTKDGLSPTVIIGPNSHGKTELLRQLFLTHLSSLAELPVHGQATVPSGAAAGIFGASLSIQLRNLQAVFYLHDLLSEARGSRAPCTIYCDEFLAPIATSTLLQRWLVRECYLRGIKLVMTSNDPWSLRDIVRTLNGTILEVGIDNSVGRKSRVYRNATEVEWSHTPPRAAQAAIDAVKHLLPSAVIARAEELIVS